MPRRSLLVPFSILLACLMAVPACKKKKPDEDKGVDPVPAPGTVPAAVSSDYLLFAQLKAKDIRDSAIFTEVKQAFTKAGGAAEWDHLEGQMAQETGIKPTDVDTITVCATDIPDRGEPKFVLILAANKPLKKDGAFGLKPGAKPDARGFYQSGREALVHFPDDKTVVFLHADLAQKYLDGYAKNRSGWPLTADLSKAAAGHTLFAVVQMDKIPAEARNEREMKEFAALLAARTVTLTADLKGKELSVAARATFVNATVAGKAKEKVNELVKMATGEVERFMTGKTASDLGGLMPAVKEAQRALGATKVEVSGPDLVVAASYKADFDFGVMVTEAVQKVREAATRMKAQNNFKQVGLALISYADSNDGRMSVQGIDATGRPIKTATEKPLLSWRVAILPYIEEGNLYKQFKLNEPWDSANNKKLIEKMPKIFVPVGKPGKPGYTHLQMVVGPNALRPGMKYPASITDGTSNTIAVLEAAEPVIWTKPDDVMLTGKEQPKDLKKKFGGQFPGGFNVALWDGSTRFISDAVSDQTLGFALTPAGGEILGADW